MLKCIDIEIKEIDRQIIKINSNLDKINRNKAERLLRVLHEIKMILNSKSDLTTISSLMVSIPLLYLQIQK